MVMMAVRSHFRPEFINRIDEFIMFDPLEQEQIKSIVRLQVRVGDSLWRVCALFSLVWWAAGLWFVACAHQQPTRRSQTHQCIVQMPCSRSAGSIVRLQVCGASSVWRLCVLFSVT